MDDLNSMLSQILSDPQSMQQLQSVAASLGLGGSETPPETPAPEPSPAPKTSEESGSGGGLDLSALSSMLGGLMGDKTPDASPSEPAKEGGGIDLSALSGIVQSAMGKSEDSGSGGDVSALTALLRSGQPQSPPQSQPSGLPFDMSTLLKLQKAMSTVGSNRANVDLLLALKPRLKEHRAKKVDDAIRVMQLIQFLPLIKESGLFGDLEGGLGGIVNGLGGGLNQMLGGLLGGGRR